MRISIENTTSKTVKKNRSSVGIPGKGVCFCMFEKKASIDKCKKMENSRENMVKLAENPGGGVYLKKTMISSTRG